MFNPVLFKCAQYSNKLIKDFEKKAFVPPMAMQQAMSAPPPGGGGAPPMDPAMMGGAPPMDPAAMGGGAPPPMDPAAMGGAPPAPPADPAAAAGGTPPAIPPSPAGGFDPNMVRQIIREELAGGGAGAGTQKPKGAGKVDPAMMMSRMDQMAKLMATMANTLQIPVPSDLFDSPSADQQQQQSAGGAAGGSPSGGASSGGSKSANVLEEAVSNDTSDVADKIHALKSLLESIK